MEHSVSNQNVKTLHLVYLSLLSAIIMIMSFVPFLGYITVGPISATLIHIPVIIGAVMLGPSDGAFLGLVFGLTSIIQATLQPLPSAFLFSPFVPYGSYKSALLALIPRILVGIVAAYVFRLMCRLGKSRFLAGLFAGVAGSLTNTILVLLGIYLFFKDHYAIQLKIPVALVGNIIMGSFATNGIVEAVVAAIFTAAITRALFAITKNSRLARR